MRINAVTIASLMAGPITRLAPVAGHPVRGASSERAGPEGHEGGHGAAAESDSLELSPEAQQALTSDSQVDEAEQEVVQELKMRDREVRSHEAAHAAAAGPYASGGPTFTYQKGPDGHRYAVGGEVQIDVAPVDGDPEATIRKMQVVRAAAMAPAEPSSQDRAVAAAASRQEAAAAAELAQRQPADSAPKEEADRSPATAVGEALDLFA